MPGPRSSGDWTRSIRSENKSPSTIRIYTTAVRQLADLLATDDALPAPTVVAQREVEEFMAHLAGTRSPGTASVTYRALQQWFRWLIREGELEVSPMARMRPPHVPEVPVPVLGDDQLRAAAACRGREGLRLPPGRRDHQTPPRHRL
jgi:integrase/recombinase XerC